MARTNGKVGYSPTGKIEDVTPDMAAKFVAAWRAVGGRAALEIFDGMPHAFVTREPDAADSRRAIKLVVDFVRSRGATV